MIARPPHGLRLTAEELLAWALASAGDTDTMRAGWHDRWSALARQLTDEQGIRTAVERTLDRHGGRSRLVLVADQFETLLADAPGTARRLDAMLGVLTARRTDGSRPAQAVVVARIDFLRQIEHDARTRRTLGRLTGHTGEVNWVRFSPDGRFVAASSDDGPAVLLWDVRTRRRLATLNGHVGVVWSAVVSPDGRTLATTGDDRTVRLWDLRTHRQLALLIGHTGVSHSPLFAPDGKTMATSGRDGTVRVWDTAAFGDLATLIGEACAIAGRSLTEREWRRYVPDGVAYRRICP